MSEAAIKEKDIFYTINLIDQQVAKVRKRAVIFVGKSRRGKSTAFNWQAGKSIRPHVKSKQIILYQLLSTGNQAVGQSDATISHDMLSCTLIPNIFNYDGYSLIDMAGFEDSRDYVGTVGVAYSLKAVFQAIEQAKFIIVVPQFSLTDMSQPNDIISSFINFFEMFKLNELSAASKEALFSSAAILFTKANNPQSIWANFLKFMTEISNPKLKIKEFKEDLIKCLQGIMANNRFTFFRNAAVEVQAQPSRMMETLNQSNQWHYFNIKNTKLEDPNKSQQKIINYLFEPLFGQLQAAQQQEILKQIQGRIQSYEQFASIISTTIVPLISEEHINEVRFNQPKFIHLINQFVDKHDHYQSGKYTPLLKMSNRREAPIKLQGLKKILQIQRIISGMGYIEGSFLQNMPYFKRFYNKLTNVLLQIYGTSQENYKCILKLGFILQRGIKEFEMLYDISIYHVNDANIKIYSSITSIGLQKERQIQRNYILSFKALIENTTNLNKYFDQNNTLDHLHAFLRWFLCDDFSKEETFYKLFKEVKLMMAKAKKSSIKAIQKTQPAQAKILHRQSGAMLIQALEVQYSLQSHLLETCKSIKEAKMEQLYMKRVQILHLLKNNAIDTNNLQVAKTITRFNRQIHQTINIYQKMLASSTINFNKKKTILKQFAQFCYNSYKIQKAIDCLQRLFDIENNYIERWRINKKIEEYINGEQMCKEIYLNSLRGQRVISVKEQQSKQLLAVLKQSL